MLLKERKEGTGIIFSCADAGIEVKDGDSVVLKTNIKNIERHISVDSIFATNQERSKFKGVIKGFTPMYADELNGDLVALVDKEINFSMRNVFICGNQGSKNLSETAKL